MTRRVDSHALVAAVSAAVGVSMGAVLAAWAFAPGLLAHVSPGGVRTHPVTAVAQLVGAAGLVLLDRSKPEDPARLAALACGAFLAVAGAVQLGGLLALWDARVDALLFAERAARAGGTRMGFFTALHCTAIGAAFLAHGESRSRVAVAQGLAIASGLAVLLALVGHAYGAAFLHGSMSLTTALGAAALSLGFVHATPDSGLLARLRNSGPVAARIQRASPVLAAVVVLLGFVCLSGQRAGLYSSEGTLALFVVFVVAVVGPTAWWSARSLDRAAAKRREAERALADSERRYRLLFEANPIPAWLYDLDTLAFLDVNAAAIEAYGYTRDEFLRMTIRDIRPTEDVPRLEAAVASTAAGSPVGGTWRHRTQDGRAIEVEISGHVLSIAGRRTELVLARDVTAERRSAAALRESEERFRALAEAATDAIVSADASGRIVYVNDAALRAFGRARAELEGEPLTVLMPARFRDAHRAGLARFLATGVARVIGRAVELVGLREDGSEFPVELSLGSWRRGEKLGFTAVIRDISRRRQAELDLLRYAAELEAANAELDAFAYSVSHDLRAPLRAIDGFSLALLEDAAAGLDDASRRHLDRIRTNTQHMGALIDDLLQLSRVTRAPLQRSRVDVSELAAAIAAELAGSDPARRVDWDIAPGLVAECDARLLRVALQNLLGNAWKYTRGKDRARVELGRSANGEAAAFYVRDNGVGFDMTYADKLFTPFQRLHSASEFEGSGVGLATVRRIVVRHGGRVWAHSAPGEGATFYFTL